MIVFATFRKRLHTTLITAAVVVASTLLVGSVGAKANSDNDDPATHLHAPTSFNCDYRTPSRVSSFCASVRASQLRVIQARARNAVPPSNPGCNANFSTIIDVRGADNGVLSSQLDLVEPYGSGGNNKYWLCYYFIGGGDSNDPDFDDSWGLFLRVWVCRNFVQQVSPSGTGPPEQAGSSTWWYGPGCGPQADDYNSYAYVDGRKVLFPYVRF